MKKLWTDMHSNIHHEQIGELNKWIEHAKMLLDFWPVAYYPFYIRRTETGAGLEDLHSKEKIDEDWEIIRRAACQASAEGYPMFMGYEWQGCGYDGDHNVFFRDFDQMMEHPMRYDQLRELYKGTEAIAIPHHVAYQLLSRGKNWKTHDEEFSPFAEIYSSHGCSENDTGGMDMERHLHMGPRTGETCYERGLEAGYHVGCMASGDNHNIPAVYDHGSMCVLAEDTTRESIWDAMKQRRVYGVSRSRMDIDFTVGGSPMGSVVTAGEHSLYFSVRAADAIDRVEILKNNILDEMVVHSGTWERITRDDNGLIRIKFAAEFGWGPNPAFYKNRLSKEWNGQLTVPDGRILSIEKAWNTYGQRLYDVTDNSCRFRLTTHMATETGHWMGPSKVVKEGFVFEIEGKATDEVCLDVDGYRYCFSIGELMRTSRILPHYCESVNLAHEVYGFVEHYRDDFFWQNAYKIRLRQAVPEEAYCMQYSRKVVMEPGDQYRLRVWLRNGDAAWVSPVFSES